MATKSRQRSGLHHPVAQYAKSVTQGKLHRFCCPAEIQACQRHLDDLKRSKDPHWPYVFDETRADKIIEWYGYCNQVRGVEAGQPIRLQPWQIFDLGCTYGWVHKDDGTRRFLRTYNKRARGNFKSTEKSGQCLYPCARMRCIHHIIRSWRSLRTSRKWSAQQLTVDRQCASSEMRRKSPRRRP